MFYDIFTTLMNDEILPTSTEVWKRKPYLRKELNELCRLTPDMDIKEIELRIKATSYLQPWAFMQVGDEVFKFSDEDLKTKSYLAYLSQANLS